MSDEKHIVNKGHKWKPGESGNPNGRDLPQWPVYDSRHKPTMHFADLIHVVANDMNEAAR